MSQKTALVTGANGGLGSAIAIRLAREHGVHIIAAARQSEDAERTCAEIVEAGGAATPIQLDVASNESVEGLYPQIENTTGRLDIIINNAGRNSMTDASEQSTRTVSTKVALAEFDTNALGALRIVQAALPILLRSKSARVVNVSTEMASLTTAGSDFYPLAPSYRISKAALNAVTVLLARDLKQYGILVNAYSPGWLRTAMGSPEAPFSADEGAQTALWLATLPDDGPTGEFFGEMRRIGIPLHLGW